VGLDNDYVGWAGLLAQALITVGTNGYARRHAGVVDDGDDRADEPIAEEELARKAVSYFSY
jgi:hypothetical protein